MLRIFSKSAPKPATPPVTAYNISDEGIYQQAVDWALDDYKADIPPVLMQLLHTQNPALQAKSSTAHDALVMATNKSQFELIELAKLLHRDEPADMAASLRHPLRGHNEDKMHHAMKAEKLQAALDAALKPPATERAPVPPPSGAPSPRSGQSPARRTP